MHSGPSIQLSAYCSSADSEIFRHFNHSVHCATWPRSLGGKTALKIAGKRHSGLRENGTQDCVKTVLKARKNLFRGQTSIKSITV